MKTLKNQVIAVWLIYFLIEPSITNANKIFELYMQEAQQHSRGNESQQQQNKNEEALNCAKANLAFEFVYEHVLFAADNVLESIASVQTVEECMNYCKETLKCRSFVFYDGGCIFLTITEKSAPKSQFHVPKASGNYIYGEKFCTKKAFECTKPAQFNRFPDYGLGQSVIKKSVKATSRFDCYERCRKQTNFECRAGNFNPTTNECQLSDMSRFTLSDVGVIKPRSDVFYFEQNCVYEPSQRCHFRTNKGVLPTHVDAYYEIGNVEACRGKCFNASFNCRSYSILNDRLCLLTHDTEKNRLPYAGRDLSYIIEDAVTYEQTDCFDVMLDCNRENMALRVNSSRLFNGKIYSKGSAESCVNDISRSMTFDLAIVYDDIACGVEQKTGGYFTGDFVIQHFDKVITSNDVWISASCQFDLRSQTIESDQGYAMLDSYALKNTDGAIYGKNEYKIDVQVEKPSISFKIVHENFTELTEVPSIGDPLAVYIEVMNVSSPYDIFVRDLVAFDAEGKDELPLIDERGCPLEPGIFNEVTRVSLRPSKLAALFSAFKFTGSDTVQFRTLVSLCIPQCEPVNCTLSGEFYGNNEVQSLGRRRRRDIDHRRDPKNDILISHSFKVADIKILQDYLQDEYTSVDLQDDHQMDRIRYISFNQEEDCTNGKYIFWGAAILVLEVIMTMFWTLFCYKR